MKSQENHGDVGCGCMVCSAGCLGMIVLFLAFAVLVKFLVKALLM
jgi:hypothetical protein